MIDAMTIICNKKTGKRPTPMDIFNGGHTPKERKPIAVPVLYSHQFHKSSKKGTVEDNPEQTSASGRRENS